MQKAEAEAAIRTLIYQWARRLSESERRHPSYTAFRRWMNEQGYGHYANFRSVAGPEYDI